MTRYAFLLLALMLFGCPKKPSPYEDHHVILLVIDTLRSDRLSAYGGPADCDYFLDRLSREAVLFRNAFAPSSWTKPSVASLLTGLYPGKHGAVQRERGRGESSARGSLSLDPALPTLAECLKNAGYRTAAFITNPNLIVKRRFDQGYDEFTQPVGNARELFESARNWVRSNKAGGKFHLYLHLLDPHTPYFPPQRYRDRFVKDHRIDLAPFTNFGSPVELEWWLKQYKNWERASDADRFRFDFEGEFDELMEKHAVKMNKMKLEKFKSSLFLDFQDFDDPLLLERMEYLVALYDAEVTYVDDMISAFFGFLEEEGLLDQSIVIITSDHGEAFLEHGELTHDRTVYAEEVNVPLLFRIPAKDGPLRARFDEFMSLIDVMPTTLDLLGLPVPHGLDGVSLWSRILNPQGTARDRPIFIELIEPRSDKTAVVFRGRKLICLEDPGGEITWQYFDLLSDPGERAPLDATAWDDTAEAMKKMLNLFKQNRRLEKIHPSDMQPLSEEELKQLNELGYM